VNQEVDHVPDLVYPGLEYELGRGAVRVEDRADSIRALFRTLGLLGDWLFRRG